MGSVLRQTFLRGPIGQGRRLSWFGPFLVALLGVLALQCVHGAYFAPVGAEPDEPAHVVTTLMYRQFLLAPSTDPLGFAKNYYSHYPYVGAGHWPPMLHLSAAVWLILLGVGKAQFMLFLAAASALTGTMLYRSIKTFASAWLATAFVAIWMMLALSQAVLSRFMTEALLACLTLAAVGAYVRYLRNPNYRLALLFAVLSSAAILTKETAVALAVIPPLSVAATRRWDLLRRGHFWGPAVLVLAFIAPWYLWISELGVGRFGVAERFLLQSSTTTAERLMQFPSFLGWPLLLLAVSGLLGRLATISKQRDLAPLWVTHAGLLAGGLAVLLIAPESVEARHLYQLSPSILLFAAASAWELTQRLGRSLRTPAAVLAGVGCMLLSPADFALKVKTAFSPYDPRPIVQYLSANPDVRTVLISASSGMTEGPLIAEVALREPNPSRYLIRSSKTIYTTNWVGLQYRQFISSAPDLEAFIDSSGVDAIVRLVSLSRPERPDEGLLSGVIASRSQDWAPISIDVPVAQAYRRITANETVRQPIRLQVSPNLGENLLIEPDSSSVPDNSSHL